MAIVHLRPPRRVKKKEPKEITYVTKVGYTVNRRVGVREAPFTTPELINQQGTGLITEFLRPVISVIRIGFQNIPEGKHWTAYNHASSVLKLTALKGTYPNKKVDFEKVKFTVGNIPQPKNVQVKLDGDQLKFSWDADLEAEGADDNDRIIIVAYFPETLQSLDIINGAKRTEEHEILPLPGFTDTTIIETYISFVNRDTTDVSDSVYSGQIIIERSDLHVEEALHKTVSVHQNKKQVSELPMVNKSGRSSNSYKKRKKVTIPEQNLRVKLISEAQRYLAPAINVGFTSRTGKGTPYSRASKYNLQNAIIGKYPDIAIDFSKLKVSHGAREGVWAGRLTFEPNCYIKLDWEIPALCNIKAIGNDRAVIVVYQPKSKVVYGINFERFNSQRKALTHRVKLAVNHGYEDEDDFIHVWMFFVSPDGKETSNSYYFGGGYINSSRERS
jgi:hypothetical protein